MFSYWNNNLDKCTLCSHNIHHFNGCMHTIHNDNPSCSCGHTHHTKMCKIQKQNYFWSFLFLNKIIVNVGVTVAIVQNVIHQQDVIVDIV